MFNSGDLRLTFDTVPYMLFIVIIIVGNGAGRDIMFIILKKTLLAFKKFIVVLYLPEECFRLP